MAKNVILFGAGASAHTGTPLLSSLIDRAYELFADQSSPISRPAFETTFDLLQNRLPALHAKSSLDLDNIETVYGLLEMAEILQRAPRSEGISIPTLVAAVRTMLAETIQATCMFDWQNGGWRPHPTYSRFAADLQERIRRKGGSTDWSILTFNYDVALDFALLYHELEVDYGFTTIPPLVLSGKVKLHKLHGSLNWGLTPGGTSIHMLNLKLLFEKLRGTDGRRYQIPVLAGLRELVFGSPIEVAIAPPSWNKTAHYRSFGRVWSDAAGELAEAENVFVVGYSAPATDAFFRDLLALSLEGPTRLKRFAVINPDEEVHDRLRRMLGPQIASRYQRSPYTFEDGIGIVLDALATG